MNDIVKDWFCEKFGVDILEERLDLIEHKGHDVIHFICEFIKDHDQGALGLLKAIESVEDMSKEEYLKEYNKIKGK